MKLLADENMPGASVGLPRHHGHDVFWARTDHPGKADVELMAIAAAEGRVVITFDKDFGELVFRRRVMVPGVVLFRITTEAPDAAAKRVVEALKSREDWAGSFSVVEDDRIRVTPLPQMR